MAVTHRYPDVDSTTSFSGRLQAGRIALTILIPIVLLATVALARTSGLTTRPTSLFAPAAALTMTPGELQASAAEAIERAVAPSGTGIAFDIVQRSTLHARPDGRPLEIVDPTDPSKTVAVDAVPASTYLERGALTPDGFHSEIRRGPDDPAAAIDWAATRMALAALVRDGKTYRDDGAGWYPTDRPPGIGLDPASAALLPTFLRGLAEPREARPSGDDPFAAVAPARRLAGATGVAHLPGIIAVDLASATEIDDPADLAFDDAGRLIGLRVVARNTHLETYDLLVETVIRFAYPERAPPLPDPAAQPAAGGPTPGAAS